MISGDIGHADTSIGFLGALSEIVFCPIYFVLGNHDFYGGSISSVRKSVVEICQNKSNLYWLSDADVFKTSDGKGIIGHDSWADGGYGDYVRSTVELSDFYLIRELKRLSKPGRLFMMRKLTQEAVDHF